MTMRIEPLTLEDANSFIGEFGSSLSTVDICKFAVGTVDGAGDLHGVAVCTDTDNKMTLEIKCLCTDGWYNAGFVLYEACCRFAKNMGYTKIITYATTHDYDKALKSRGFVCKTTTEYILKGKKNKAMLWSKELE